MARACYAPLSKSEGVATADTTVGVYALPEINRKQLVRGAANAFLPPLSRRWRWWRSTLWLSICF